MRRQLPVISFILFFFLPLTLLAQNSNKLWIEVNSGFTYMGLNHNLLDNWGNGWNIGTGATYRFNPQIEIGTQFSYQKLVYKGNKLDLAMPQFVGPPTLHTNGKPTNMYEVSAALRLIAKTPYIKPFFSMGWGVYFMDVGRIALQYWPSATYSSGSASLYDGSGKIYRKTFGSLGIGFEVPLSKKIQLRLEGQYTSIFNSFGPFVPVTAAFQMAL